VKKNGSSSLPSILCIFRTNFYTQYQQTHDDVKNLSASEICKHQFNYRVFSPQNNMYWCEGNVVVMTHVKMIEIVHGLQITIE